MLPVELSDSNKTWKFENFTHDAKSKGGHFWKSVFPKSFVRLPVFSMEIWSMHDPSKLLWRIWIFKYFKCQKFLEHRLPQYRTLAESLCPDIDADTRYGESDASSDLRGTLQSNFCVFSSFMINTLDPYLLRNFDLYQGGQNPTNDRFISKMCNIQSGMKYCDL